MTCRGYLSPKHAGKGRGLPLQNYWVLVRLVFVTGTLLLFYFFNLQPLVQESKSVYNTLCGSHLDFVYEPHPVTGMPVFASMNPYTKSTLLNEPVQVNEIGSLRCFYAATYEMLRMRAGFDPMYSKIDNITIWTLVNGSNPVCTPKSWGDWTPCLERDLRYVSSLSLLSWASFFQDPYWCKDQDVSVAILSSTCLNESFLGKSPELGFFKDVLGCRDFKPTCQETRGNLKVTVAWQDKISKLCPVTCGVCQ